MRRLRYYIDQIRAEGNYVPKNLGYLFTKKKKAVYIGCTGQGNLGDEAILKATSLMLAGHLYLYEISYAKPSSGKFLRKWIIKNPDYIILGGGTIIRKGADESYLKILNDSIQLWSSVKIVILGPGVAEPDFAEYIGFPIDILGWKKLLKKSSFISVRGIRSKKILDSWLLDKNINILHDPAIWFSRKNLIKKQKQKRIGLNFADIGDRIYGKNPDLIKNFAMELVSILQKENWTIFLYPTTKSDMDFMLNDIGLKHIKDLIRYDNYTSMEKSLDFLESLDIFVGQRLHSIIFAATVSTPFYALEYEPKTKDFLETINMENYGEKVDKMEADEVLKKIDAIYLNIDFEQSELFTRMMMAKKEQEKCLNLLLKKL